MPAIGIESDIAWQDPEPIELGPPSVGPPPIHPSDWRDGFPVSDPFGEAELSSP